jgi:ABC-2 type transport system ATP-binding protein
LLIAQALVHKPKVVVLDEPTAGVDVELRKALWAFTQRLHQQGHTILLTTHYLEEAENLCERIAILNDGQLVALDKTRDLLAQYPYRLLCLQVEQVAADLVLPDALRNKVESIQDHQLTLRLHREQDHIGAVLESLSAANIRFHDLSTSEPKLEDVFVALTGKKTPDVH